MRYFIGNLIKQFLICLCASFVILGLPILVITDNIPAHSTPANPDGLVLGLGALLSFVFYGLGCLLRESIFNSPDSALIPLTPLTPRRLFLQAFKSQFGFILGLWGLYPALILVLSFAVCRSLRLQLHPLTQVNLALTCLVLMLYPLHLRMSERPWVWNFFFFSRRIFTPLRFLFTLGGKYNRLGGAILRLLIFVLLLTCRFWGPFLVQPFNHLSAMLNEWGAPGMVILYLFLPLSGLPYLSAAGAPPQLLPMLTAVLCALLLCCLRSIYRMFNFPIHEIERNHTDWWLENREAIEEIEEAVWAEAEARASRPWAGNAAREGFAGDASSGLDGEVVNETALDLIKFEIPEEEEEEEKEAKAEPEVLADETPFPADASLEYQPDLPAAAQIRRHDGYWYPVRDSFLLNPWLYGVALALAVAARLAGVAPHWAHPHPALLVVLIGAIPVLHLKQTSRALGEFIVWAQLVPLRWPRLILANAFAIRHGRLALDLALLLALALVLDCPLALLPLFPLLFVLNRLTLGLIYWLDARSRVGGIRAFWLILAIPYLILWFVAAGGLAGVRQDPSQAGELIVVFLVSVLCVTAVLLILGVLFASLLRLKSDTQVVAPPSFKLVE